MSKNYQNKPKQLLTAKKDDIHISTKNSLDLNIKVTNPNENKKKKKPEKNKIKENKVIEEKSENNENPENSENVSQNGFGIQPTELENIIGKYKERGTDYQDLKYFK